MNDSSNKNKLKVFIGTLGYAAIGLFIIIAIIGLIISFIGV